MKLYHYTQEAHLEMILSDGFLKLGKADSLVPNLVWLTSGKFVPNICRPKDQTVSPPRFLNLKFYRFILESKNLSVRRWPLYQRRIKGAREGIMALEQKAVGLKDNPRKWYVSETRIPIASYELAETDPDYNFFIEGGGAINFFAP